MLLLAITVTKGAKDNGRQQFDWRVVAAAGWSHYY